MGDRHESTAKGNGAGAQLSTEDKGFLLDALISGNLVTFAPVDATDSRRKVAMRLVGRGLVVLLVQHIPNPFHNYFRLTNEGTRVARALKRDST